MSLFYHIKRHISSLTVTVSLLGIKIVKKPTEKLTQNNKNNI